VQRDFFAGETERRQKKNKKRPVEQQ